MPCDEFFISSGRIIYRPDDISVVQTNYYIVQRIYNSSEWYTNSSGRISISSERYIKKFFTRHLRAAVLSHSFPLPLIFNVVWGCFFVVYIIVTRIIHYFTRINIFDKHYKRIWVFPGLLYVVKIYISVRVLVLGPTLTYVSRATGCQLCASKAIWG